MADIVYLNLQNKKDVLYSDRWISYTKYMDGWKLILSDYIHLKFVHVTVCKLYLNLKKKAAKIC